MNSSDQYLKEIFFLLSISFVSRVNRKKLLCTFFSIYLQQRSINVQKNQDLFIPLSIAHESLVQMSSVVMNTEKNFFLLLLKFDTLEIPL